MQRELILYGAGGAGREVAFALSDPSSEWKIAGFVDDNPELQGKTITGIPVLGNTEWLIRSGGQVAVLAVGSPRQKRKIIGRLQAAGTLVFPTVIAPGSRISPYARFGTGCVVAHPWNYICPDTQFGDFVFINCTTRIGHDTVVGDFCTIYSGIDLSGGTHIGEDSVIGSGAATVPNVKIGRNCIIGTGAVVARDVPDNSVAAGVPARVIRENR
jgi:sugar O-acyltransferase (sialic acid O-acetyltransferase NeuD family)